MGAKVDSITEAGKRIEAAIAARLEGNGSMVDDIDNLDDSLHKIIQSAADPLVDSSIPTLEAGHGVWEEVQPPEPGALWADLRPSEAGRLAVLVTEAMDRAHKRAKAAIVEELTAAGLSWAVEVNPTWIEGSASGD